MKWIQIRKTWEKWTCNELQSSCQKLGVNLNLYDQNSKEFLKLFFENLFKVGINWESLFDAVSIHHQVLSDNYERLRLMENRQIVWLWTAEKDLYFQMLSFLHGKFYFYFESNFRHIRWCNFLSELECFYQHSVGVFLARLFTLTQTKDPRIAFGLRTKCRP